MFFYFYSLIFQKRGVNLQKDKTEFITQNQSENEKVIYFLSHNIGYYFVELLWQQRKRRNHKNRNATIGRIVCTGEAYNRFEHT